MANDAYVTWLGEFSVKLFYLHKVTSLGEIAKTSSYLPYINFKISWIEAVCQSYDELKSISATFRSK